MQICSHFAAALFAQQVVRSYSASTPQLSDLQLESRAPSHLEQRPQRLLCLDPVAPFIYLFISSQAEDSSLAAFRSAACWLPSASAGFSAPWSLSAILDSRGKILAAPNETADDVVDADDGSVLAEGRPGWRPPDFDRRGHQRRCRIQASRGRLRFSALTSLIYGSMICSKIETCLLQMRPQR